jgi:general nucleoside transport system permease protein
MLTDFLQTAIVISVLASTVRIATPLLLAALGELVTEKAGILNLGVEGTMLMGAFVSFLVANQTGSQWMGLLGAIVAGGVISLIMAFMSSTLKVDQVVTGLSINLLGSGVSLFWYRSAFPDFNLVAAELPTISVMEIIKIPLLSEIPFLGPILFSHRLLTYLAFLAVPAVWFFLYHTKYGLQIRGLGENPRAIDMKGLNVTRLQYLAAIFGGMMAALGGSFLTLGSTIRFFPEISAGRGWLAIVIVIAGNWRPARILIATLLFAFLDAFQLQVQGFGVQIPYQILLAMPYILAILVMMGGRLRSVAPRHLGIPYQRE